MSVMSAAIRVVRVRQVMDGVHQRLTGRPERLRQRGQAAGLLRVEAKLDVEDVEIVVMTQYPGR
jgi:hypothetical protein